MSTYLLASLLFIAIPTPFLIQNLFLPLVSLLYMVAIATFQYLDDQSTQDYYCTILHLKLESIAFFKLDRYCSVCHAHFIARYDRHMLSRVARPMQIFVPRRYWLLG